MRLPIKYLMIITGLFLTSSCEKLLLKSDIDADPLTVFDYLWNDINNRYSYFEEKKINWDSLGVIYRDKVHKGMNEYNLFNILSDMLFELKDGHVNLMSVFNRSRNWEWARNYPSNYNENIIEKRYLGRDYNITGPLRNQIIDSVLYVNYNSFASDISPSHLNQLMLSAEGLKGVIIDVRNNGGGSLKNAYRLASCFTDEAYDFARQRLKSGPERDHFSAWQTMTIKPREGNKFLASVIVLTNRRSYSATTFFSLMMKTLPNVTIIGDQTGGGGGTPVYGELPNGWTYRFSASQTVSLNGEHIEFGVPVNIVVNNIFSDEAKGMDTIIETALRMLR